MSVADALSMMAAVYSVVPVLVFLVSRHSQHVRWVLAVAAAPLVAEAIKRGTKMLGLLETEEWTRRPKAASNCNTWNSNGPQGGAPGFPSGHTATTAAFWVGAWILTDSPLIFFVGILATVAMAAARLQKRCHTVLQVIGGGVLGASVSYGLLWQG
jgi:membrane-associated phospholipid phosphatase